MSVTKLSSLCKCLSSRKFGNTVAICLPAKVVAISSTPKNSINRHNRLVCGKPQHRKSFCHVGQGPPLRRSSSIWMCGGEEERKRTILASSRKRVNILYPLQWKSIVLVFNKFVCVMSIFCNFSNFYLIFGFVSQDFWSKLIINAAINNHIILLFYEENIYIWDSR